MPTDLTNEYRQTKERARMRLENFVIGSAEALRRINEHQAGWSLNLFQEAGEATGSFHSSFPRDPIPERVQAPIKPAPKKRPAIEPEDRSAVTAPTTDSIV